MPRWALFFVITSLLIFNRPAGQDSSDIDSQVDYTFGGQISIQLTISDQAELDKVTVFIRSEDQPVSYQGKAEVNGNQALYVHDLTEKPLPAFSNVEYWFDVRYQDGKSYLTEPELFYYEDNRFRWYSLKDGAYQVHWYEGDNNFAQMVLEITRQGLTHIQEMLDLPTLEQVDIYVYASGLEMQSTMRMAGIEWIAGHADPDLGVVMVTLPPGPNQRMETERQIPHELLHILLYQALRQGYDYLPAWLNEGLASLAELKPNPDYVIVLDKAVQDDVLLPINALCDTFPTDAANFYLSYAESTSFTRYLFTRFGNDGMMTMIKRYADGVNCDAGIQAAFGFPLVELEKAWRQAEFNEDAAAEAVQKLLPWGILMLAVLAVPLVLTFTGWLRGRHTPPPAAMDA